MKTIRFYGASDDLCEVEGDAKGCNEYCSEAHGEGLHHFAFIVRSRRHPDDEGEGLRVNAFYDGTWSFAVGMLMEDAPMPNWPASVGPCPECSYSTMLTLTVPDDAEVVRDSLRY